MFKNYIDFFIVIVFFYPILSGFLLRYRSKEQKKNVYSVCSTISFLLSIYIGIFSFKDIFIKRELWIFRSIYEIIPEGVAQFLNFNPYILFLVVLPLIIFMYYITIKFFMITISGIVINPIFDAIEKFSRHRSSIFNRILGAIFEIPKAIIYVIILCFLFNYITIWNNGSNISIKFKEKLEKSILYKNISNNLVEPISNSKIAKKLPEIINESFKVEIRDINDVNDGKNFNYNSKVIVYYNGITLEESVQSNDEIDKFSKNLIRKKEGIYNQSKEIYNWISSNVAYDYNKASMVMKSDFSKKSGAINTFSTRKGICLDYASLFVAMCRANDIPVRIVTGKGFNGDEWVNHAWNEVYIKEKNIWVSVDPTFGVVSNYFDNPKFTLDHKEGKVVGQW